MTIPDDVLKAAREAVIKRTDASAFEALAIELGKRDFSPEVQCAAVAIMAERERCAKVAEAEQQGQQMLKAQAGAQNDRKAHRDHESMSMCAGFIADAIRRGEA